MGSTGPVSGAGLQPGLSGRGRCAGQAASDDELVSAAAAGDRSAFEILARRWWARIGKFCAAAVGFDERMAEDAAQDALLRLYQALPRFREDSSFGTFVYRICRNASIDLIRRTVRERKRTIPLPEEKDLADTSGGFGAAMVLPGPEDEFLRKEADHALVRAMARLKVDERALVYLKDAEGLGTRELAGVFSLPEGTVKSRLSRIRAKLADMLKEEDHA